MGNQSYWSSTVSYDQFAVDSFVYLSNNLHQLRNGHTFREQFFEDVIAVARSNKDPLVFVCIALFTVVWTVLRYAFTGFLVKPIAKKYKLPQSEQNKLPECTWNFCYYSSSWLLTAYILIVKEKGLPLLRPESEWIDWQFSNNALPFEYQVLYVAQLSFYLHSIYAIVALDCWRKDSVMMVFHHLIAIALVFCGFSARAHQAGTVTIFLHDICDVFLEGTKTAVYFKIQGKKKYPIFEVIGNVGFILFCLVWFCTRLYVFPLRLIWSCTTLSARMNVRFPLSALINVMLYVLLVMNLYWFTFIVKLIYKVATGTDKLKDLREYEEKTEMNDDISSDSIHKNDVIGSTSAGHFENLHKRNKGGIRTDQ